MSFQDRQYSQRGPGGYGGSGLSGITFGMPKLTPLVKYLLIINIGIFVIQLIAEGKLEPYFAAAGGRRHMLRPPRHQ